MPEFADAARKDAEIPFIPDVFSFEPCAASDRLLICFSSAGSPRFDGKARWDGYPVNRLFIRDPGRTWYNSAIEGLCADADGLAEVCRTVTRRFDPAKTTTTGGSMGGYGAVLFGILLKVGRIVAVAPQWRLTPGVPHGPAFPVKYNNLHALFRETADAGTKAEIFFGTAELLDLYHNFPCRDLKNMRLHPVDGSLHNLLHTFKQNGTLDEFFARVANGEEFPAPQASVTDSLPAEPVIAAVESFYLHRDMPKIFAALQDFTYQGVAAADHFVGRALYGADMVAEAAPLLEEAVKTVPDHYEAAYQAGLCYLKTGDYAKAESFFKVAAAGYPKENSLYYQQLGSVQRIAGKIDEAFASQERALAADPHNMQAVYQCGLIFYARKEFDRAADSFRTVIAKKPQHENAPRHLENALRESQRQKMLLSE